MLAARLEFREGKHRLCNWAIRIATLGQFELVPVRKIGGVHTYRGHHPSHHRIGGHHGHQKAYL